ncbi:hypothetical protein BC827DRAFT_1153534 [Russula dissimulans]|nr:hypothetical protein BC827DRAFT_1153534 [Russula dissimulans]
MALLLATLGLGHVDEREGHWKGIEILKGHSWLSIRDRSALLAKKGNGFPTLHGARSQVLVIVNGNVYPILGAEGQNIGLVMKLIRHPVPVRYTSLPTITHPNMIRAQQNMSA